MIIICEEHEEVAVENFDWILKRQTLVERSALGAGVDLNLMGKASKKRDESPELEEDEDFTTLSKAGLSPRLPNINKSGLNKAKNGGGQLLRQRSIRSTSANLSITKPQKRATNPGHQLQMLRNIRLAINNLQKVSHNKIVTKRAMNVMDKRRSLRDHKLKTEDIEEDPPQSPIRNHRKSISIVSPYGGLALRIEPLDFSKQANPTLTERKTAEMGVKRTSLKIENSNFNL